MRKVKYTWPIIDWWFGKWSGPKDINQVRIYYSWVKIETVPQNGNDHTFCTTYRGFYCSGNNVFPIQSRHRFLIEYNNNNNTNNNTQWCSPRRMDTLIAFVFQMKWHPHKKKSPSTWPFHRIGCRWLCWVGWENDESFIYSRHTREYCSRQIVQCDMPFISKQFDVRTIYCVSALTLTFLFKGRRMRGWIIWLYIVSR